MISEGSVKTALLIYPPTGIYDRFERCQSPVESESVNIVRPAMDLAYLASVLEGHGIRAEIRDYPAAGKSWKDVERDIRLLSPDLFLVSATLFTCREDCRAFSIARKHKNGAICVLKGFFPDRGQGVLCGTAEIDLVLWEEPEDSLEKILSGTSLRDVPGIAFRDGTTAFVTRPRPALPDLDSLPFPARHLLDNGLYRMPDNGRKMGLVLAGKGCFGECTFCLVPRINGRRVRLRGHISLIKEIEECVYKHGIKDFWLRTDNFTADRGWVLQFCSAVSSGGLSVRWAVNSRADCLDKELGEAMKEAGCFAVGIGAESGSEDTLKRIKKNITKDQVRAAVKVCRECGLQAYLFFIIGFPWETKEHISETVNFACELKSDAVDFSFPVPFYGTELFSMYEKTGLLKGNGPCEVNHYGLPRVGTMYLSADELVKIEKAAYRRLFFNPEFVLRRLSRINSLRAFLRHVEAAWHLLKMSV